MKSDKTITILVIALLVATFFGFCRGIFVSENEAVKALETQGYTNVKVVDSAWLFVGLRGADSHDAAMFTCRATNPAGKDVEVRVCCGWPFKGATIRTR